MDDKPNKEKFEPLTKVKPSLNPEDEIDLKEKDSQFEPGYLEENSEEEKPVAKPTKQPAESTANYSQFESNDDPKSGSKKMLYLGLVALLVIAAGAGYWLFIKPKPAAKTTATTTTTATTSTPTASTTEPAASGAASITTTTKKYTSTNFNLAFTYPDDWVIADTGSGVMTVKSPALKLTNSAGQSVSGAVLFNIKNHVQKLTEFDKGNATATRDSIKISYTKPTQTQRANTYVSYLQYATTTTSGALDGLYITGDSGYLKGQNIPLVDVSKVDPNITITFVDSNSKALSIADSMMSDATFSAALLNILKSLSIN